MWDLNITVSNREYNEIIVVDFGRMSITNVLKVATRHTALLRGPDKGSFLIGEEGHRRGIRGRGRGHDVSSAGSWALSTVVAVAR